jgi:hypothetical protein
MGLSRGVWVSNVGGVGVNAVSRHFGDYVGTTRQRHFLGFEQEDGRTLAQYQAITV